MREGGQRLRLDTRRVHAADAVGHTAAKAQPSSPPIHGHRVALIAQDRCKAAHEGLKAAVVAWVASAADDRYAHRLALVEDRWLITGAWFPQTEIRSDGIAAVSRRWPD